MVNSVHTVADVDEDAGRERRRQEKKPRDPQAQVVKKGNRRKTDADGQARTVEVRYLGYKSHTSVNAETGLITTVVPTAGSAADNKAFPRLLAHDEEIGVPAAIHSGDKAYDDTDLHYRLWATGRHSALRRNDYITARI